MYVRRNGRWLLCATMVFAGAVACGTATPSGSSGAPEFERYADPPAVRSFPTSAATVNGWIAAQDTVAIRQHAWDMWESVTSTLIGGTMEPVWETWYSGHELFEMDTSAATAAIAAANGDLARLVIPRSAVRMRHERPRQFGHGRSAAHRNIPTDPVGAVFSFNRFTATTARQIYGRRLWDGRVLRAMNDSFDRQKTPVALRQVLVSRDTTDSMSIVLKPVFQFIDGQAPSCIPYWAGDTPATTDSSGMNPIVREWKQFVLVDPKGTLSGAASPRGDSFANCPDTSTSYPIVGLDRFYHRTLTQAMVDSFSVFSATGGDDLGRGDSATQAAITAMIKAGNIGLLVAMHVTGKEIVNWTWQSFWWSPTPNDSLGFDRPRTIRSPWNNYQMTTAYWMTSPPSAGARGTPRIAYNPYLETSLTGIVDTAGGSKAPWYGPQTNCMSCHRMASWRTEFDSITPNTRARCFTGPRFPYVPASYVDAGNATLLGKLMKTDFLWSVAIRTAGIPPCPST